MKKNSLLVLSAFFLFACAGTTPSSSSIKESSLSTSESSVEESISSKEESSSISSEESSSKGGLLSSIYRPSSEEESSSVIENPLAKTDALKALSEAKNYDYLISSLKVLQYNIKATSYQVQNYTITSYSDNVLIMNGLTTDKDSTSGTINYSSEFTEQRSFEDNTYYRIRKFNNTYLNTAHKESATLESSKENLNIFQGALAHSIYQEYSSEVALSYVGEILDNNTKHFSFVSYQPCSYDNNMLAYGIEVSIAPEGNITDLFYTKGYYDTLYCDYNVATLRKHGPLPPDYTVDAGYTYTANRIKTTAKTELGKDNYPFSYEDNFLSSISFASEETTVQLSAEEKYVNLVDFITTSPNGSLTGDGCPLNNLVFTSDNTSVIKIGDTFYGDFISKGTANISVTDPISGVTSPNKLKIIVE